MESNQSINKIEDKITLKDLFLVLWNWKWVLLIIIGVGAFLSVLTGYFVSKSQQKVATIVTFNWEGISLGEMPDGQRFEYGAIFNATIYADIIEEKNLSLSVSEISDSVSISPIIPDDVTELIRASIVRGNEYSYNPTSFKILFDYTNVGMSSEEGKEILNLLIEKFRLDFERKYVNQQILMNYTNVDLSEYDYIEAYNILESQADIINNKIESIYPAANTFYSAEKNMSFNDILVMTELFESIELNIIGSRINNYLLTKDKELLISMYNYNIEKLQLMLNKEIIIESDLQILIDNYQGNTTTILIPGLDMEEFVNIDPYINTLYQKIVESQFKIAKYQEDIAYYNVRIDRLEGNDPDFIISPEVSAEQTAKVETEIAEANTNMQELVDDMNFLMTEYNRSLTKGFIKVLSPAQVESTTSISMVAAIGTFLALVSGVLVVFVLDYKSKNKIIIKSEES